MVCRGDKRLERWGLTMRAMGEAVNNRSWPDFCFRDFSLIKVQKRLKADQMDELRLFKIREFTNILLKPQTKVTYKSKQKIMP